MQVNPLFVTITVLFMILLPSFGQAQQQERPIVRLIYFLPKDREPQPDIDEKMDALIKDTQQFYANQIEAHGFGRKTFQTETDTHGNAVVHRVIGKFTDAHYSSLFNTWAVWEEIDQQFDASKNIYVTVVDIASEFLNAPSSGSMLSL